MAVQILSLQTRATANDADGNPLPGAKIYTYETGTTTPLVTYTTSALSVANTNPIIADAAGRFGPIYTDGSVAVKLVITTAADATVDTLDPSPFVYDSQGAAASVSYTPNVTITGTNVQDALDQAATRLAGLNVTQSNTDTTAGRLLKVGDFGLGANVPPTVTDIDAFTTRNGFYLSNNSVTTGTFPTGATVADALMVIKPSSTQTTQIASTPNSGGHLWHRRSQADASWNAWRRIYDFGNILGTAAQSAGVPTGAILEASSNANGFYQRTADGVQICWHTLGTVSGTVEWTFPVAFAATPYPQVTPDADASQRSATVAFTNTTKVNIYGWTTAGAAWDGTVWAIAIGRWF